MKVALVRRGYSATGGAEAYLRRFAQGAVAAGHECVLFSEEWPRAEWPFELRKVEGGGSPMRFAAALELARPQEDCDVLFSLERVLACDVYRAGDGVHAAWLERRERFETWWRQLLRPLNRKHAAQLTLERTLFQRDGQPGAGMVIANSHMVRREIEERFGYPAERIHVVYNGVPAFTAPENARAEVRAGLGLGAENYVALFAGSGWDRKGLRFAIEAMNAAAIPNATLLVAGRGEPKRMPASTCTRFLGPRADLPRLLAAADVFILPTIYDPFSNACLEALAAGLSVITTRANGFAEILAAGVDGEIIESPDDVPALSAALKLWASPERRAAARLSLREKAAQFTIEENVRKTLAILELAR